MNEITGQGPDLKVGIDGEKIDFESLLVLPAIKFTGSIPVYDKNFRLKRQAQIPIRLIYDSRLGLIKTPVNLSTAQKLLDWTMGAVTGLGGGIDDPKHHNGQMILRMIEAQEKS